ncbi:MAG: caspase family protein, partial [Pseudomonadota bacterium]
QVYELNPEKVRLDSTTASSYCGVTENGLFESLLCPNSVYQTSVTNVLRYANLFGDDNSQAYSLDIAITDFTIPRADFGGFASTLKVHYILKDSEGNEVFNQEITSGGMDDTGSNLGPVRQNRSRSVAVANNIEQFVSDMERALDGMAVARPPATPQRDSAITFDQSGRPDLAPVEMQNLRSGDIDFGTFHALIIGNDAYSYITPLQSAVADARRLNQILSQEYGYKTHLLLNATRDEIVTTLTGYRRTLGPQDNLLIYYAGHGWVDEAADEGYWLPVDANSDDPARWLSNATLTSTVRAMNAKHVLVIADSCFSGKLTRGLNMNIRDNDYLRRLVNKKSRTAMTSGGLEPVLDSGGDDGHSVFAGALFDALTSNEGVVDTSQLFNVIRRQVALDADQFPEYGDIRRAGHDGGDFVFVRQ